MRKKLWTEYAWFIFASSLIALTAASFGISFASGNQNTYLLGALKQIDSEFLSADWLTQNTHIYHHAFSGVVYFLHIIGIKFSHGIVLLDLLLKVCGLSATYLILRALSPRNCQLVFLWLLFLILLERTQSIADSYIFSSELQPSSFASVLSLIGFLFFVRGRYLTSGLFFAIAGYMHTNFLLLGFIYLGLAHLQLGREGFIRRSVHQFLPMVFVLLPELPFLIGLATSEYGEKANYILQKIRAPHHYVPNVLTTEYLFFLGWSLLGLLGLRGLRIEIGMKSRVVSLHYSMLLLVVMASIINTVTFVPQVSQLFFWRLSPFSILLSQAFFLISLFSLQYFDRTTINLSGIKNALLLISGAFFLLLANVSDYGPDSLRFLIFLVFILFFLGLFMRSLMSQKPMSMGQTKGLYAISSAAILLMLIYNFLTSFYPSSTLINGFPGTSERRLYDWVQTTNVNAVFLTPPTMENFRIHGKRAIVVDWKSTPMDPDGLLEWYKRLEDVSKTPGFKDKSDVILGYNQLTLDDLWEIAELYQVTYVVTFSSPDASLRQLKTVFANDVFFVFELPNVRNKPQNT